MTRLPDHLIDEVRARVDIVDVVSEYVTLQRSGRRFRGLCPFHAEKTPSFYVDQEKQLYHCFGCRAGGNVFTFLCEIEKAPFVEVVRRLAERVGVPLDQEPLSPEESRRRREEASCRRANEVAKEFFIRALFSPQGEPARRYLKERGLDKETVQAFGIGFAPPGGRALRQELERRGIPVEVGVLAGLLGKGQRGAYDWFRGRIMFPVSDARGRVVAFGGRALGEEGAKYINTAETPLFTKGEHLYGLDVALRTFRPFDRVILVEGYMDVVSLYRHGIGPAVASLGTAFTPSQARLIKRYANEVILAYDADGAGKSAAQRGLALLAREGLRVRVARLPEGDDPDSFVRAHGKEAFERLLEAALPLTEYQLEAALAGVDVGRVEGRIEAVRRILPVLSSVETPVGREEYVAWAAERIGVSARAIHEELLRFEAGRREGTAGGQSGSRFRYNLSRSRYTITDFRPQRARLTPQRAPEEAGAAQDQEQSPPRAERALLAWLLREPDLVDRVKERLGEAPFSDRRYNQIFDWLARQARDGDDAAGVVGRIADPELARVAGEVLLGAETPVGPFEAYLEKALEESVRRQVRGLEAKLGSLMNAESMSRQQIDRLVLEYRRVRSRLRPRTRGAQPGALPLRAGTAGPRGPAHPRADSSLRLQAR